MMWLAIVFAQSLAATWLNQPNAEVQSRSRPETLCRLQVVHPYHVRRALENTALPLGGSAPDAVLTYGRGLIQVGLATFEAASICALYPANLRYRALYDREGLHRLLRIVRPDLVLLAPLIATPAQPQCLPGMIGEMQLGEMKARQTD